MVAQRSAAAGSQLCMVSDDGNLSSGINCWCVMRGVFVMEASMAW
jgi:hypothetical protein